MKFIKKLFLLLLLLLPISIRSFVLDDKTSFLPEEKNDSIKSSNYIIALTDKDLSLDLEDYVIGVVAGEMPALFEEEALKAQAVAARSFVLSKGSNAISSTINDQVFLTKTEMMEKWGKDYELYYNKIASAVKDTENLVIKRDDKVLKTFYFAMSNGYTENSDAVFDEAIFISVESKWDNEELKNFIVETKFTTTDIIKAFNLKDDTIVLNILKRNNTNHVEKIKVNNQELSGIDFRKKLGLRSTDFDIKKENDGYIITTKGYGHGVGMSQYGANGMAKEGYDFLEILKHYYNDIEVKNI